VNVDGSFEYHRSGGPTATFTGFNYTPDPDFIDFDHTPSTSGTGGLVYGVAESGPSVVSFSTAVQLVEMFVWNFNSDFDNRTSDPQDYFLFKVEASYLGIPVFTYDRAAESEPGDGVVYGYIPVSPTTPVIVDAISFHNFYGGFETASDAVDDLTIEFISLVPEPVTVTLMVTLVAMMLRRGRIKQEQPDRRVASPPC
jgi:hypothetical protein